MKTRLPLILILFISSCTLTLWEPGKDLPTEDYSQWSLQANYVSHTSTELIFDVHLVLSDKFYPESELLFENQKDFIPTSPDGQVSIVDFHVGNETASGPGSSVILMDLSGDYSETDPYNNRAKMFHKYFEEHHASNEFLTGGFANGGLLPSSVYFLTSQFQSSEDAVLLPFFKLSVQTGGQNNIYDALNGSIGKLSALTNGYKKHCLVLTHGNDQSSTATVVNIISTAKAAGVKVHIIAMGKDTNVTPLSSIASQTGGMFAYCQTNEQMIAVSGRLYRMLYGTVGTHQIRMKFLPTSGVVASGDEITGVINIDESVFEMPLNPVCFSIKVP